MKKLYLVCFLFLVPLAVFADIDEVCEEIFDSNIRESCIDLASAGYFDPEASRICSDMASDRRILSCVSVIRNKTYDPAEIIVVRSYDNDGERLNWLKKLGTQQ